MDHRATTRSAVHIVLAATLAATSACARSADIWLEGRTTSATARGSADDASPSRAPASYGPGDPELWAADSLTSAYSEEPRPGRLAGGVAAEPVDTAAGPDVRYATARSLSRVVFPMEVRAAGKVELQIDLTLADVEIGGAGLPRAEVSGTILGDDGSPVPGGDIGALTIEIRPDGAVLIDQFPDATDALQPNGRYSRTLSGPIGGVRLERGRYRVGMELVLEATAATSSGPYQLARIGRAAATLRVP